MDELAMRERAAERRALAEAEKKRLDDLGLPHDVRVLGRTGHPCGDYVYRVNHFTARFWELSADRQARLG